MKKFTYKDTRDWKVADVNGKTLFLTVLDEDGEERRVERFDGYRSASRAAKKLNGTAKRA